MRECPDCGRLFPDAETACPHDGHALVLPGEADPLIGQTIGSYTLTRRLGRGGMGTVYLALHPGIGSQVAIKLLHHRFASDPAVAERFFNEARAVNLIGHENIVQIFDFGHLADGTPYFVMEWLNGHPLSEEIGAPMPLDRLVSITTEICEGLQAAHDAGIVHRDLKPDNVFLVSRSQGVQVKILDFGIAKLSPGAPSMQVTASDVVMGTASYLSPEQAAGETAKVSPESDIYALGVILYQLASGRLPFQEATYAEMLVAHLRQEPPPLSTTVPAALAAIIDQCLRKRPEDRFRSMRELRERLMHALEPARPVAPAKGSRRAGVVVLLGVLAAVTTGIALWVRRPLETAAHPRAPIAPAEATLVAPPAAATHSLEEKQPERSPVAVAPQAPAVTKPGPREASPNTATRAKTKPKYVIPREVGDGMIDVRL